MKKFTNKELLELYSELDKLTNLTGDSFAYKIIYNKRKISELIDIYNEMISPNEEYKMYQQERIIICEKYSSKDENGKSIIKNNLYDIIDTNQFNIDIRVLSDKYKETLVQRQEVLNNSKRFLDEIADIELKPIYSTELPKNISVEQMEGLFDLIEEK